MGWAGQNFEPIIFRSQFKSSLGATHSRTEHPDPNFSLPPSRSLEKSGGREVPIAGQQRRLQEMGRKVGTFYITTIKQFQE